MTKEEAMKLALEALENSIDLVSQEARNAEELYGKYPSRQGKVGGLKVLADQHKEALAAVKEALAQPEQKPLAWISTGPARMFHWTADKPAYGDDWVPLYTAPPQRKPLTDEDIERIVREARVGEHGIGYTIARAIEAAHNIKE